MQKQIENATVNVSLWQEDMGGEFPGECCWSLSVGALRRIFAHNPKLETAAGIPDAIGDAIEYSTDERETLKDEDAECAETLDDFTDEKIISFRDADSGILLVHAMGQIGGEWEISWSGENETWFFHDWDHATYDVGVSGIVVDEWREERAQINGARDALQSGIALDTVCEALASILEPFRERFGEAPRSLFSRVFEGFEVAKLASV